MKDEILSDFSPQWCQDIIHSPDFTKVEYDDRCAPDQLPEDRVVTNTLFSRAWKTESTVRAQYGVQAKVIKDPNATPETIVLYSLGPDLGGYRNIAHGGTLLALVDQTIGECALRGCGPSVMTLELKSTFKRAFGLPGIAVCRAVGTRREGKKLWLKGTLEDKEGRVYMEATALFLVRPLGLL